MAALTYWTSPNLAKHDIQFQIGDNLSSNHLPTEVQLDAPPHSSSSINHTKYIFEQTDRKVIKSILQAAVRSTNFSGFTSTSDLDKYADFIVTAISTAVDKAIQKSKSKRSESNPINQLQKQIKDDINGIQAGVVCYYFGWWAHCAPPLL